MGQRGQSQEIILSVPPDHAMGYLPWEMGQVSQIAELKEETNKAENFPAWNLHGGYVWAHTFSKTSDLLTPISSPTPSGVPRQEILAADLADHSAAQQTDTTLCPNREGAE